MVSNVRDLLKVGACCVFSMGLWCNNALAETPMSLPGSDLAQASQASQTVMRAESTVAQKLPLADVELSIAMSMQPPFSFLEDSLSEVQGIDVDLVRELQKRTGFKLKNDRINVMHFSEMMGLAMDGKLDIVAGGVSLTESRRQYFDFSEAHMAAPVVLVSRKGSDVQDVDDLANKVLAVERGAVASSLVPNADELNIKVDQNTSNFMCVYSVHDQNADALIMDEPMAEFYVKRWEGSNLHIVDQLTGYGDFGFLFKKGADFSPYLQDAFHDMLEDGTVARIISKHLGEESTVHYMSNVKNRTSGQAQTAALNPNR